MINVILRKTVWQILAILAISACLALGFNQVRANRLPLACQWTGSSGEEAFSDAAPVISVEEAAMLFRNQKAVFLDARPESSYNEGHIQGAVSLPWQEAEEKCFDVVEKIPPDTRLITYCDGASCDLCDKLAVFMCDLGFEHVSALNNGWTVWNRHGLPVEKGEAAP